MESNFLENILPIPKAQNSYEKVVIVATRARQLVELRREEFYTELETMGVWEATKEHLINTNGWQEMLAKSYEEKPSPLKTAQQELRDSKLVITYVDFKSA